MKHLTYLFCLLIAMSLACSISAPIATPNPAPIETATVLATEKPANKAKKQAGYTSTVTADLLNIRTAPMGAIIPHVWLIEGEQITVIECQGVWGRIGAGRWVNTLYLESSCDE